MTPFDRIPHTAEEHFKLWFFAAVLGLRERCPDASEKLPFLLGYDEELDKVGLPLDGWQEAVRRWEAGAAARLPLSALRDAAGLDAETLTLLFTVGLVEEDGRFAAALAGGPGSSRPTPGVLASWFPRVALDRLLALGLVEAVDSRLPRLDWALQPAPLLWGALRGGAEPVLPAGWVTLHPFEQLPETSALVLEPDTEHLLRRLPDALAGGTANGAVIRGPGASGRRTLLFALARSLGMSLLELRGLDPAEDLRWRAVGPLATVLRALPAVSFDLGPGETALIPALTAYDGPIGVALGRQGGVTGPPVERAVTIELAVPGRTARRAHWAHALADPAGAAALGDRYRMTGGNIRRTAALARAEAALAGRVAVTAADVRRGSRALHGRLLDTLAERVPPGGGWHELAVADDVADELALLETRCRHREQLAADSTGTPHNAGVRALFTGPSGTGKTLAARLLASALDVDLYRLDLATVVNKYIGETEKNLSRLFARAEEADIALLLDEGDALMTQRTSVQSANDRYANLETNYLLQRLESFEGILIVTTNAGDRIDGAFRRRMDFVVEFRTPGPLERLAIWDLHLPDGHAVDPGFLDEVSARCELTGGEIRNAALHALLLALPDDMPVADEHLESAIRREYRKSGRICPLRPAAEAFHA